MCFLLTSAEEKVFYLMGTYSTIELEKVEDIKKVYKYMRNIERKLSTYLEDSEVSKINKMAGIGYVKVSSETIEVIKKALEISERTYGYFDITIGAYTINFKRKGVINEKKAKSLINYKDILIKGNTVLLKRKWMAIDLGGIGKGYAIEKAYRYINTEWGFISIGGEFKIWGKRMPIGIKDPLNGGIIALFVNKEDICVSTSGNYYKEHIESYDRNVVQVTVLYPDCTYADAYATAIFAMPENVRYRFLKENPDVGVFILYADGNTFVNQAFLRYCKRFKVIEK